MLEEMQISEHVLINWAHCQIVAPRVTFAKVVCKIFNTCVILQIEMMLNFHIKQLTTNAFPYYMTFEA